MGEAQAHQTENPDKELKTQLYFNPVEWAKEGKLKIWRALAALFRNVRNQAGLQLIPEI